MTDLLPNKSIRSTFSGHQQGKTPPPYLVHAPTVWVVPATALAVVVGVNPERQSHVWLHGGGGRQAWTSHLLPLSALATVAGAEAHRPVDEVEDQEHDGEHHEEHVVHLGPVVLLQDLTEFAIVFRKFPCSLSFQTTFLFLPEKIGVTYYIYITFFLSLLTFKLLRESQLELNLC